MSLIKSHWRHKLGLDASMTILATFARAEAERSGVFSRTLLDLIDRADWSALIDFVPDYTAPIMDVIHARQAVGFFEKFEPLGQLLKVDRKAIAFEKFLASEALCYDTNEWFRGWRSGDFCCHPTLCKVLFRAQRKIRSVLGPAPQFADLEPRLGPGASTTLKRVRAVPSYKLVPPFACSPNTVSYLESIFCCNPALLEHLNEDDERWYGEVTVTPGRLEFVPKDARSYRSIVVEPGLSSMYQLAVGAAIESRLRRVGVDIRDQSRNQRLAREGSLTNQLATIDLSSASDTISYELVKFLVPPDWFDLLTAFRSPQVTYRDLCLTLEKFSSMGNGSTFPLETLIFWALVVSTATHKGVVSAYGDDLICHSSDYAAVTETLKHVGFVPNMKKSYSDGPFRESCGKDYVNGVQVRPYRQKDRVSAQSLFVLHNFYFRNYDTDMCALVESFIHPSLIIRGPDGYGDGHLLGDWSPIAHNRKHGYAGFVFETFSPKERRSLRVLPGDWVAALYCIYASANPEERYLSSDGTLVKVFGAHDTSYRRTRVYTLSPA